MRTSDFKASFIAATALAVASVVIQSPFLKLVLAIGTIAPILFYARKVRGYDQMTSDDVDSVYYLGFLVTIMTLVASAISLSMESGPPRLSSIVLHFASGLAATAVALYSRIMLLADMSKDSDEEERAAAKVLAGTEQLADRLSQASGAMSGFLTRAQGEMDTLETRIASQRHALQSSMESMDVAFRESLRVNSEILRASVQTSAQEAHDRAMASVSTAAQELEGKMHKSFLALDKIGRDAAKIDMEPFVKSMRELALTTSNALQMIAKTSSTAGDTSAKAIGELTTASRKTILLATKISASLESLRTVHDVVEAVNMASENLKQLGQQASNVEDKLVRFAGQLEKRLPEQIESGIDDPKKIDVHLSAPLLETPSNALEIPPIPVLVRKATDGQLNT